MVTRKVSVIIPVKKVNDHIRRSVAAILAGDYKNFEIIVIIDEPTQEKLAKTKFIVCPAGPAEKRDAGARKAGGELLAFLDDDAYPAPDWLNSALVHFQNPQISAVGGPGVTPPDVSWKEVASGWVSASPIGSGGFSYRFLPETARFVDDYPSMNLLVRKADFLAVGGFDSHYWPGEDTKLCLDLVYKLHKKIIYEPRTLVYHHRRLLWLPHLKQNGNFGIHRGFFARVLPQTSARLVYFMPSALVISVIIWIVGILLKLDQLVKLVLLVQFSYLVTLILNSLWIWRRSRSLFQALVSIPAIFITHLWYGIRFGQGFLFTRKLSV